MLEERSASRLQFPKPAHVGSEVTLEIEMPGHAATDAAGGHYQENKNSYPHAGRDAFSDKQTTTRNSAAIGAIAWVEHSSAYRKFLKSQRGARMSRAPESEDQSRGDMKTRIVVVSLALCLALMGNPHYYSGQSEAESVTQDLLKKTTT
jgi:hypothetical protein